MLYVWFLGVFKFDFDPTDIGNIDVLVGFHVPPIPHVVTFVIACNLMCTQRVLYLGFARIVR